MRHLNKGRKLGLKKGPRRAFLKILLNNLITREKILTTEGRAKELRPLVERLITHGKRQNLTALRLLMQRIPQKAAYKIYHDLAPRYKERKGGYTRIIKQAKRRTHDGSKMAVIEFIN